MNVIIDVVYNAYSYFFSSRQSSTSDADTFPVAERSLLLMLLLATQSKIMNNDHTSGQASSYRLAFANLRDHHGIYTIYYIDVKKRYKTIYP